MTIKKKKLGMTTSLRGYRNISHLWNMTIDNFYIFCIFRNTTNIPSTYTILFLEIKINYIHKILVHGMGPVS